MGHRAKSDGLCPKYCDFAPYILLIFALRLGLVLKVVGLDAELHSLSNGDVFKQSLGKKRDAD